MRFNSIKIASILSDETVFGHLSHSHSLKSSKGCIGVRFPLQKPFTYKISKCIKHCIHSNIGT